MHQHALDAILERHGARIARAARAAQLELDEAVVEAAVLNVAAVLLDGRADARLEQLLDHAHHLAVALVVPQAVVVGRVLPVALGVGGAPLHHVDQRLPRRHGLGDERKDLGPDVRPVGVGGLGHGDEVGAVEDGRDAVDVHELRGERGRIGGRDGRARRHVLDEGRGDGFGEDAVVREELEGVGVGRALGLDEDGAPGLRCRQGAEGEAWSGGYWGEGAAGGGVGLSGCGAGAGLGEAEAGRCWPEGGGSRGFGGEGRQAAQEFGGRHGWLRSVGCRW